MTDPFTDVTQGDPVPAEELDEPVEDGASMDDRPDAPVDSPEPEA